MRYSNIVPAVFISRPNRFIAEVEIEGRPETVHVKNTGRCRELLIRGCQVWLEKSSNPDRRTAYDLIAVEKLRDGLPPLIVNMDSQLPNALAEEWLRAGALFPAGSNIRREVTYSSSRFDFCIEYDGKTSFLEVKGVTLENDGIASFPDAPTERGVKHLKELIECKKNGLGAYILFVIQMDGMKLFRPNDINHKEFGDTLRQAIACGVECIAVGCKVAPDSVQIDHIVPIDTTEMMV